MDKKLLRKCSRGATIVLLSGGTLFGVATAAPNKHAASYPASIKQVKFLTDIRGTVTDEKGQRIPGVTVKVKGTNLAVSTNADGNYNLQVPDETATLVFSFVGYQTKEVNVGTSRVINIALIASPGSLNEVVVVGYGTQKKATLTGSVTVVKGAEIVKSPSINVANSLAGRLPGVIINNRTGAPGQDDPSISVRGRSTTGNSSALVIIDGVERSGLGQINPNDIESITVLKDASAAIYGARAANGVILVTTKRGSLNTAPEINLSYNQGFSGPTRNPIMADSYTFFNVYNEIEQGEGRPARYSADDLQKFKNNADDDHQSFDWYKFITKDFAPQHRTDISVAGGTNGTTYRISVGEASQDGQYKTGTTKYQQYNLRSNIDIKVTDNFKIGMNIAARFDNNHSPWRSFNEINSHIYLYQPNWVPYWPGTDYITPNRANDNVLNFVSDGNGYQSNKITTLQTSLTAQWDLPWVKGLSANGTISYDPNFTSYKTWQLPTYVYYKDDKGAYTKARSGFGADKPDLLDRATFGSLLYATARLNYAKKIGDHNLTAMAGFEQQDTRSNFIAAYRSDFASTSLPEIFAGSSDKSKQGNDGSESHTAKQNYFGRLTYDYAGKYLAEFTFRRDGSPNFRSDKRWGNFPGGSLGWRMSEEKFMKKMTFIDDLKIRASYGVMGNDLVNSFQYLQTYGYGNNYVIGNNDVTGLVQTGVPNPNITWEKAKTANIGLDASLWKGKLGITFDVFKTRRSDILTKRSAVIPGYTGLVLPDENVGIVDNKGFELVLSHTNNDHDFKYNISGNIAFARNKVIFSDEQPAAESYQLATGRPIGAGLYYNAIGIFKDQAAVDAYPHYLNARPGDIQYEDVNKDGKIDSRDQIRINQTNVPEITFGFSANFSYKSFDLSFLLQGQANAKQYFGGYFPVMSYALGNFLQWRADDRWTPQNTNASMPRASYDLFNNNTNNSTQWLLDAGFLKLRNVELGYNLPQALVNKIKMKKARIFASGSNLLIVYDHMKKLGFDPETSNYWYYPPQRVINFGVNVTF